MNMVFSYLISTNIQLMTPHVYHVTLGRDQTSRLVTMGQNYKTQYSIKLLNYVSVAGVILQQNDYLHVRYLNSDW